jgi:hypothetical protein
MEDLHDAALPDADLLRFSPLGARSADIVHEKISANILHTGMIRGSKK